MYRYPTQCPTCGGKTVISEVSCTRCDTAIQGSFTGCRFCQLSDENVRFLELFIASRGNVKEMERETGLGYWTIRGQLNDIIEELGLSVEETPTPADLAAARRTILEAVERGELSIEEAEQQLLALTKKTGS
jgi:hypothetical protein